MAKSAGEAIGIKANTYFVTGTGSGQPNGIVTAASLGKTAAGAAAITGDEIIDLYHSLLRPYRKRAVFLMKDSTVQLIRKLKSSDNQYLWQPGLQAGQPDVLLGRPLYTDPDMPAATTGLKSVLFADVSKYWIRSVGTVTVKRLEELYAATGQVGFRVDRRLDGDLVDSAAAKYLIQA
jgi:HK97 family phage major capsid protein